jgi:tRNA threonylcarbamoyl adenosine modification protein YjeE
MPLKTSKRSRTPAGPWRAVSGCSEAELSALAGEFARELRAGDRVLLEGPLGAGKSTFARALIEALGVRQPAEGSPTFAIAHEYSGVPLDVVHIDFYRLRSETEIDEAGIPAYFWERRPVVLAEWISSFPAFAAIVRKSEEGRRCWEIELAFTPGREATGRDVRIFKRPE